MALAALITVAIVLPVVLTGSARKVPTSRNLSNVFFCRFFRWLDRARRVAHKNVIFKLSRSVFVEKISKILLFLK